MSGTATILDAARRVRRLRRRTSPAPAGQRLPLSALRSSLDSDSPDAHWSMNPDGVLGRSLMVVAGGRYVVPLSAAGPIGLRTRVMLVPHDWRDRQGSVLATIHATDATGHQRQLWSTVLTAMGPSRGQPVTVQLPADTRQLTLAVHPHTPPLPPAPPGSWQRPLVHRAIFHEPTLIDPTAPPPRPASTPVVTPPAAPPQISVLTPVHDPPIQMLREAIDSVLAQTYPNWELCLVDDGSTHPEITAELHRYANADPRIKLTRHPTAGGISTATNTALHNATGDYIALLDHDDTLAPDALQQIADTITAQPDLDMIYTDEDVVAPDGGLLERHVKPGWSPDHMDTVMYTCHLGVYRRRLALELGGFQSRFDGCQDYDFVLRLMERTDRIAHVPQIAYHWRAHAASTAGGDAKPYAYLRQPEAIAEHLARADVAADIQFSRLPGLHRVVHRVAPATTAEIVVVSDDADSLQAAARSWLTHAHPSLRVVVAAPAPTHDSIAAALLAAGIAESDTTIVEWIPGVTSTAALAAAANAARGELLCLMQSPAIGLTHDWLTRLVGYAQRTRSPPPVP